MAIDAELGRNAVHDVAARHVIGGRFVSVGDRANRAVETSPPAQQPIGTKNRPVKRRTTSRSAERHLKTILSSPAELSYPRSTDIKRLHAAAIPDAREQEPLYSKLPARHLIPLFRKAVALRNEMCALGFSDDHGPMQSAERILDALSLCLNYPGLAHIDQLKHHPSAEFSPAAREAHNKGRKIVVAYAVPIRELTCAAIEQVNKGASGDELIDFIKEHYRPVLSTPDEIKRSTRKAAEPTGSGVHS